MVSKQITPAYAQEILLHSCRYMAPQPNGCVLWTGSKRKDRYAEVSPIVHMDRVAFRVRRLVWIADGQETHPSQKRLMTCGSKWCVSIDHMTVDTVEPKQITERKRVQAKKDAAKQRRELIAKAKCDECGAPRGKYATRFCPKCARTCLQSGSPHKLFSAGHLRAAYRARELRLGRVSLD